MTIIQKILKESKAYTGLDLIMSSIESGGDLSHYPVQPIYTVLKGLGPEKVAELLVLLSPEQRQAFIDIDLWNKDDVDVDHFEYWIKVYSVCSDEDIVNHFIDSSDFSLFLKARFNIWTFDIEDPLYPEHDNFFITDDDLLLFEYDEDFDSVNEVKFLIKRIYAKLGVDKAYAFLFKLVSDSFSTFQESEYQQKKYRMAEIGFVDYYDSIEIEGPYPKIDLLENEIKKRRKVTPLIDSLGKKQALHSYAVTAFEDDQDLFSEELSKVSDQKRLDFLNFNFIRAINATLTFHDALRDGRLSMSRVGRNTKSMMSLGFSYIKNNDFYHLSQEQSLFDYFDFIDLYKFGKTLVYLEQKKLKKFLSEHLTDEKVSDFLGARVTGIIDGGFQAPPEWSDFDWDSQKDKKLIVDSMNNFLGWKEQLEFVESFLPFACKFFDVFCEMRDGEKIQDSYYINYDVEEIDLECILISSFANYVLGLYNQENVHKMGLTLKEFREFTSLFFTQKGILIESVENKKRIDDFSTKYGFKNLDNFQNFLKVIINDHLSGYDFEELLENDYKHVGGPIILDPGH